MAVLRVYLFYLIMVDGPNEHVVVIVSTYQDEVKTSCLPSTRLRDALGLGDLNGFTVQPVVHTVLVWLGGF